MHVSACMCVCVGVCVCAHACMRVCVFAYMGMNGGLQKVDWGHAFMYASLNKNIFKGQRKTTLASRDVTNVCV